MCPKTKHKFRKRNERMNKNHVKKKNCMYTMNCENKNEHKIIQNDNISILSSVIQLTHTKLYETHKILIYFCVFFFLFRFQLFYVIHIFLFSFIPFFRSNPIKEEFEQVVNVIEPFLFIYFFFYCEYMKKHTNVEKLR